MQPHDLPGDVLRLVLRRSCQDDGSAAKRPKANLPLLAVCRRWRYLALAAVYSGVDIHYDSRSSHSSGPGDDRANNTASDPDRARITTNLDLVVSAGCVQTVNQAKIVVDCKASPFPSLGAVIQLMRAAAEEWRGVRELDISISPTDRVPAPSVNMTAHSDEIKKTSAALAAIMSRICRMTFSGYLNNPVVREFGGQLAAVYSGQLDSLVSQHAIAVRPGYTFRQLKRLSILYDSSISCRHTSVEPANLVSLDLGWWPSNHSWAPFSAGDGSGAIEFSSLKNLRVAYRSTDVVDGVEVWHRDGHPWRLHFPKLHTLNVNCGEGACPLLEYAVLPPRMDEISIRAAVPVLVQVAEMKLPPPGA